MNAYDIPGMPNEFFMIRAAAIDTKWIHNKILKIKCYHKKSQEKAIIKTAA